MIRLYNTLTRKKEDFQTLEPGVVKMYVCGVTVYNDAHVGHAMSALVFDIIRRYLEFRGYKVNHVMNFTDVDDKIINRANQLGEGSLCAGRRLYQRLPPEPDRSEYPASHSQPACHAGNGEHHRHDPRTGRKGLRLRK